MLQFHYAKDARNFGRKSNGTDPFQFLPTGIMFGITFGGGPLISVDPFLTNRFIALLLFAYIGNMQTRERNEEGMGRDRKNPTAEVSLLFKFPFLGNGKY